MFHHVVCMHNTHSLSLSPAYTIHPSDLVFHSFCVECIYNLYAVNFTQNELVLLVCMDGGYVESKWKIECSIQTPEAEKTVSKNESRYHLSPPCAQRTHAKLSY